ncbi:MAG: ATP-binding protein [Balneolaceae bacterium]
MAQPTIERGILDLSSYNFENDSEILLNGEWQFFWNELIEPNTPPKQIPSNVSFPHLWNNYEELSSFGYATYKIKIILPKESPKLALTLPDMYSSYRLYFDDTVVAQNGIVGKTKENYVPNWLPLTVPLDPFQSNTIDVILQVSNFDHHKGGVRLPISLGKEENLQRNREIELGYTFVLTGSLIMGSLFFFGLYSFGKQEKTILYFALFCLVYSYRIIGTELYPLHFLLPNLPWILTLKMEYISLYLSASLFGIFIKTLYPNEASKYIMNGFNYTFLFFSLAALVLPAFYFTSLINYFFTLLAIYIVYTIFILIRAYLNKEVGSVFALASIGVVFIVFIYDLLEYFIIVNENLFINFIGYISFFFLQSLTLSNRFAHTLNQAKESAETASVAKTHFLSTMGHELRTPLNAVIGLSELLLDSKSEKEKMQFASTIKKSGENLLSIINNILDFTKIESSDVELEYTPTHVPYLIADIIKMLGSLTDPKKVKLSFRFDDSLPEYIKTDSTRLRQILINLIGNAIKFTDEGEISVQVTTTESISEKGQILFIVKDSGIGIPEDKMNLLFDRFSQIEADRNRRYGGTGLGLAISKRLIEGMGGRIWVQSKKGSGTTFYFTIASNPISRSERTKLEDKLKPKDSIKSRKELSILAVEDNLINQKVVLKVLERLGYDADIANNGFEAVQKVQEKSYDLIFMDMEMPEMDGIEATIKIKELGEKAHSPTIIAVTANATTEDRTRCFEAGMVDFISKPITLGSTESVLLKWFPL